MECVCVYNVGRVTRPKRGPMLPYLKLYIVLPTASRYHATIPAIVCGGRYCVIWGAVFEVFER